MGSPVQALVQPHVRPLPVTGYASLSALGASRGEILAALAAGRTGLAPADDRLGFETSVGRVTAPLPELGSDLVSWSTDIARMAALLVSELDEPLRRARARWRPERIGVILGTSTAGTRSTEHAYREYVERGEFAPGFDYRRHHSFGAVLRVVAALSGARGPAWMISTACTSSAKPLASAQRLIAADILDAALVGGIDTLCALTLLGFQSLQLLDRRPCRPFSQERAGLSLGEGGALLLVERTGEARVLIEGVGETSDAYHISAPHPAGLGAARAMSAALAQAGRRPDEVDHINAHGTGTALNDSAEAMAIASLFGEHVPVVSTKGFTGHTLGAAGAIECALSACAIEEGWIPPSLHADPLDPELGVQVPITLTRGRFRHVLSNSFAFGGSNVSVLLGAP